MRKRLRFSYRAMQSRARNKQTIQGAPMDHILDLIPLSTFSLAFEAGLFCIGCFRRTSLSVLLSTARQSRLSLFFVYWSHKRTRAACITYDLE